eukprot:363631-Chlamydomonas_euryale.AAC.6
MLAEDGAALSIELRGRPTLTPLDPDLGLLSIERREAHPGGCRAAAGVCARVEAYLRAEARCWLAHETRDRAWIACAPAPGSGLVAAKLKLRGGEGGEKWRGCRTAPQRCTA